jgi:hypothetical protein
MPGWVGDDCKANFDECVNSDCVFGQCVDGIDSFTCNCTAGFDGKACDNNINDCVRKDCGHGQCIDEVDGFSCTCDAGWNGDACKTELDECALRFDGMAVCSGNGNCTDYVDGYGCSCEDEWMGNATKFFTRANGPDAPNLAWGDCNVEKATAINVGNSNVKDDTANMNIPIILGVIFGLLLIVFGGALYIFWKRRKENEQGSIVNTASELPDAPPNNHFYPGLEAGGFQGGRLAI